MVNLFFKGTVCAIIVLIMEFCAHALYKEILREEIP